MREGYQTLIVVNLFTLRSTDPQGLLERTHKKLNTYDADMQIALAASQSEKVICAWGEVHKALDWRCAEVLQVLREAKRNSWCLGKTLAGQPKHPLYLSKNTPLMPFQFCTPELIINKQETA